jgi:glycosyltransferase involved in cell wall biosynthesis
MKIAVILCTYNRCQILSKALSSLAASVLPDSVFWEIVVVDNNSNDQTREVVEQFCNQYSEHFRYLRVTQSGKSFALNAGIRASEADVLAFTDDDITVEPSWLWNLTQNLAGEAWAGAAGKTVLSHPFSPPGWLALDGPYSMAGILAPLFDRGDSPRELDWAPFGANMAYRKRMFEKYGFFRTDLGPTPDAQIPRFNEDTEFGRRLMSAGERLRYEPSAIVYHPIHQERSGKKYILSWWFDFGRAGVREEAGLMQAGSGWQRMAQISRAVLVVLPRMTLRWLLAFNPKRRFYCKCLVWKTLGQVLETRRLSGSESTVRS